MRASIDRIRQTKWTGSLEILEAVTKVRWYLTEGVKREEREVEEHRCALGALMSLA